MLAAGPPIPAGDGHAYGVGFPTAGFVAGTLELLYGRAIRASVNRIGRLERIFPGQKLLFRPMPVASQAHYFSVAPHGQPAFRLLRHLSISV